MEVFPFSLSGSRGREAAGETLTKKKLTHHRKNHPPSTKKNDRRQTIVIDKKGKVAKIFNSQFEVEKHVEAALEALKKL